MMTIDWRKEVSPETVADLVARKKYARAIELVKSQLETEPTPAVRLQLANLLVRAGRGPEAVPFLLHLADELAALGFLARAIAALKRVEKLEPGRSDVESRLQSFASERAATVQALRVPAEPPAAAPEPAPPVTPVPEEVVPEEPPPLARPKSGLLGVFRRLFGSEGDAPEKAPADEPPLIDFAETVAGPRPGPSDDDTKPKILLPGEHPDAPPVRRPRREPAPGEEFLTMPEDALLDRVEDLIEDLFQPALGPAPVLKASEPAIGDVPGGLTGLMFDELGPEERLSVLRGLKVRTFEPGDVLVTEGEPAGGLYLLTAGGVKVYTRDENSRNHALGRLEEGDFFGEIASRMGLPRSATVVASAAGEMLELDQVSLDRLAVSHPRVWGRMHAFARERAQSRQAASADEERSDPSPGETFEPKLRLRVASAFLRAGQREEAVQILLELADDLVRRGEGDKAVALLKKVDRVRSGEMPGSEGPGAARPQGPPQRKPVVTDDKMGQWIGGLAKPAARAARAPRVWADRLAEPSTLRAYAGLRDCRLFDEMGEEELLTLLQRLPLESCEPGDIVLTEGEPSDSVLVLATGSLKVFVRQQSGRDTLVRELGEGDFLGEIGVLAGLPRTATTTVATPSMLLRIDRKPLEALCRRHPHARQVLEEVLAARSTNPDEPALREGGDPD